MSDSTVAASDVMNAPLPREAAAAAAMRTELTGNVEYMKDWRTDQGKQSTLGYLRWVAGGNDPDAWGKPPSNPDEVRTRMLDRDRELDDARLATWEKHIRMDDQMRFEHRRGLATRQQHDDAVREIDRMKRDRAFGARVLSGDQDAVDKWMRFGRIAAMQVAPDDYDWTKR